MSFSLCVLLHDVHHKRFLPTSGRSTKQSNSRGTFCCAEGTVSLAGIECPLCYSSETRLLTGVEDLRSRCDSEIEHFSCRCKLSHKCRRHFSPIKMALRRIFRATATGEMLQSCCENFSRDSSQGLDAVSIRLLRQIERVPLPEARKQGGARPSVCERCGKNSGVVIFEFVSWIARPERHDSKDLLLAYGAPESRREPLNELQTRHAEGCL